MRDEQQPADKRELGQRRKERKHSTRQLHGRQYSFTPTHKLLLMTNYKPHADARDQAFWSRACLLEFGMRFVARPKAPDERWADPALKEKLRQERSGILAWLVRGCLAFQELGLAIPASISLATEKYRDEEDRILHFLNECCVLRPEATVKASVLYEAYKAWCEENQFGRGMNATLFGNEIGRRFAKKRGNTGMIYQGVSVLTTQERGVGGVYSSKNASVLVHTPESLFDLCDLNSKQAVRGELLSPLLPLQHAASGLLASTDTVIAYRSYRSAFTHETDLSWNR